MRNTLAVLTGLLTRDEGKKKLSAVLSPAGLDLWLAADVVSGAEQLVKGSGLNIGDYILHEDDRLINNLGPVVMTVATV